MNRERMEAGIRLFLDGVFEGHALDADKREIQADTPRRVAEAFQLHLLSGYAVDVASLVKPMVLSGASGPVALRGIGFTSLCQHHLLPYRGVAHLGFLPAGHHIGLGTLANLVDALSRRLTLQEPLTAAIADALSEALAPSAVLVCLQTEHGCLATRGARKEGHRLVTLERRGEPDADLEWMVLGRGRD